MANLQRKYSKVTAESRPRPHNLRDRRRQPIGQHKLDPELVKPYAVNSCGMKTLRCPTREQIENFVESLANCAEKYRNALRCQLNSYLENKEGAA